MMVDHAGTLRARARMHARDVRFVAVKPTKRMSDYSEYSTRRRYICCPLSPNGEFGVSVKRQLATKYITLRGRGKQKQEFHHYKSSSGAALTSGRRLGLMAR